VRDLAGVATLAVATLWIGYLVPHRLRHRQLLLESRAEDRFSGALRVLAVTDRPGRLLRTGEARAECGPGSERFGLLTPGRGIPVPVHVFVAVKGGGIVDRPREMQDRMSADAARRAAQLRAQRAASLARRAAAARRRAVLTLALLTLSAAGWVVVGLTTLAVLAAVAPTVLLVAVLVLGRRAVVHAHTADVAWDRARPSRRRSTRGLDAPVVGRAFHPSDDETQLIARVTDGGPRTSVARAAALRAASADLVRAARVAAEPEPETRPTARVRPAARATAGAEVAEPPAQVPAEVAESDRWSPVPVPRPVYTTKAEAPRREPIPLVLDEPVVASAAALSGVEDEPVERDAPVGAPVASVPTLDLDAILARRRNAG